MGRDVAMVEDNVNEHGYSKKRTLLPVTTSIPKKKQKMKNTKKRSRDGAWSRNQREWGCVKDAPVALARTSLKSHKIL